MSNLKERLKSHLFNIPGWQTRKKIVVFESDDWGAIRMPSKRSFELMCREGIPVETYHYDLLDSIERREDLQGLIDTLGRFKESTETSPVFTFNTVMGNPDFDRIKLCNFEQYFFEPFRVTYERYYGDDCFALWQNAIDEKLIVPQFHAREHLNVSLWMSALRANSKPTVKAFHYGYYGLTTETPSQYQRDYLAAQHVLGPEDAKDKSRLLLEGLEMFEDQFGHHSETFIACNYVWPKEIEEILSQVGVRLIQGQRAQMQPVVTTGKIDIKRHFTGQKNKHGQRYLVRNCLFEPSSNENKDWVDSCLSEIQTAFLWNKPAIISSHRVNYIGSISAKNRSRNLKLLERLVNRIIGKWNDVEFLASPDLVKLIST